MIGPSTFVYFVQAEVAIVNSDENKEYLAIEGLDAFRKGTVALMLGADHPAIKEVRSQFIRL